MWPGVKPDTYEVIYQLFKNYENQEIGDFKDDDLRGIIADNGEIISVGAMACKSVDLK